MKQKLLLFFAVLFISTVSAQNFNVGGVNYFIISAANRTVGVNASANYVGALVVPSTVSNANVTYTVVSILDSAFQNSTTLTSIVIPNTVTEIRNGAFRFCTNLTSVTIPNSVTWIGELSFNACFSLTSVVIPNSVTTIGNGGFAFCTGLTSLTISNSLTSIGLQVFENCTSLTSVTIPNSVSSLGRNAFASCTSLNSVIIGNMVTSIGDSSFGGCANLTAVEIPNSVVSITANAFVGCTGLTSVKVNWATPLTITSNVFFGINIGAATLRVPVGTVAAYQAAPVWQNFGTIVQPPAATHLNFDGANDYITAGNILPSSYTKEAMIFLTANSSSNNIISGSNSAGQHALWVPNMKLSAGHNGTWGAVQDAANLALNTWYHVAVSYDSANQTLKLYKNGVLISTATNIPAPVNGNQVLIGAYDNGNLFNGNIDEVRVWNRALSLAEIQNNMNCELPSPSTQNGLVAYYQFNQGIDAVDNTSITSLTDASGNVNNGTLTNFAKTGSTSNWLSGSPIVTGTTCSTQTLSNSDFAVATNIKMYPNPTNNFVTVEVNNLTNATLEVVDVTGKILMTQSLDENSNKVDLQKLPFGMYFFKVNTTQGNTVSKVIKN